MIKVILFFICLTSTSYSGVLDFLKSEKPLSFEKFIFKYSLKGVVAMNLRQLKKINAELCDDDFSIRNKKNSKCTFKFLPPNKVEIFIKENRKEKTIIYDLNDRKINN